MCKKTIRNKKILFFIVFALILGNLNVGSIRVFAADGGLTMHAPQGYTPINTPLINLFNGLQAMVDAPSLLLIEDVNPWSTNAHHALLQSMGQVHKVKSTEAVHINFSAYDIVVLSNDQLTSTYNNYALFKESLEKYVADGGIVLFGAADRGWNGGYLNHYLPGGLKTIQDYVNQNTIFDQTHPIVTGERSGSTPLTNAALYGNYCSHTAFVEATLPAGGTVILKDSKGNPTLVEYPLGNGTVIASGLTWEHNLAYTSNMFAAKALDDLFMHTISASNDGFFFHISPATGLHEDIVAMTVSMKGNPGIAGLSLNIDFDNEYIESVNLVPLNGALSVSGAAIGSIYSNMTNGATTVTPGSITAVWSNASNVDNSGDLFAIQLKIKSNAYTGKYPIVLSGMVVNDVYEELTYNVRQGILTVTDGLSVMYGDIYTDEVVNIKDVVKFSKYFAGTVTLNTYETFAADVHKDDKIDIRDAIKLSQYVAGYTNITLGSLH